MIISHKHKFIFIKTRKTAGTSIEIALSKICGKGDIITPITPEDENARKAYSGLSAQNYNVPLNKYKFNDLISLILRFKRKKFYNHMPCQEIRQYVDKKIWKNYFKFTIERNPFDRIVSLYFWKGRNKNYNSIYEFISKRGARKFNNYALYSIDNVVVVDKVYKYEEIEYFLYDISMRLELNNKLVMPEYRAKSKIRKNAHYRDLLDQSTIGLVKVLAAREIALLNYDCESKS